MKIYQIHKTGGSDYDYYDYIIESHLHEEKAYERVEEMRLEQDEYDKQAIKCRDCEVGDVCIIMQSEQLKSEKDKLMNNIIAYCDDADLIDENKDDCINFDCKNYKPYYGEVEYEVEEIDVIE